jgi:ribosomal protein S18 acetylase RimI-like enzyme
MNLKFIIVDFNNESSHPDPISDDFKVIVFLDDEKVGYLMCYHELGKLWAFESFIKEEYRCQGIGTKMYDYAMEVSERTIYPHHENPYNENPDDVSDDAISFWERRSKV